MAKKYLFIAISFYHNIVRKNVSCEKGLSEGDSFEILNSKAAITILSPELGAHLQSDSRGLDAISESPVPPQEGAAQGNLVADIDGKSEKFPLIRTLNFIMYEMFGKLSLFL